VDGSIPRFSFPLLTRDLNVGLWCSASNDFRTLSQSLRSVRGVFFCPLLTLVVEAEVASQTTEPFPSTAERSRLCSNVRFEEPVTHNHRMRSRLITHTFPKEQQKFKNMKPFSSHINIHTYFFLHVMTLNASETD